MTIATTERPETMSATCPPWCGDQPHPAVVDVHCSPDRKVATEPHNFCCDATDKPGMYGQRECPNPEDGINAYLFQTDGEGVPQICLRHLNDVMPHMSLTAAAQLADHIRSLIQTASHAGLPPSPVKATKGADRPYWLAGDCPDWCLHLSWNPELHSDRDSVADRQHISCFTRITLASEDPVLFVPSHYGLDGDIKAEPMHITTGLAQDVREAEPRVYITHGDKEELHMTLGEADELIGAMQDYVRQARGAALAGPRTDLTPVCARPRDGQQSTAHGGPASTDDALQRACQEALEADANKVGDGRIMHINRVVPGGPTYTHDGGAPAHRAPARWQTEPCPPWCHAAPGGHSEHGFIEPEEDRHHDGLRHAVILTTEDHESETMEEEDGSKKIYQYPRVVTTEMTQHWREAEPRVLLNIGDPDGDAARTVYMTLAETNQLGLVLVAQAQAGRESLPQTYSDGYAEGLEAGMKSAHALRTAAAG